MVIMMVVDNFGNFEIMCRGMSDLMKNAVFLDYKYRHDRNHFQPEQIFQNERQHQMTVDAVAQAVQSSAKNKVGIFQIYTTYLCSHVSAFIFICGIPILRTVSSVRQNCFSWILKYVLVDIANFDLVKKTIVRLLRCSNLSRYFRFTVFGKLCETDDNIPVLC